MKQLGGSERSGKRFQTGGGPDNGRDLVIGKAAYGRGTGLRGIITGECIADDG
jgi:hypothetical protein